MLGLSQSFFSRQKVVQSIHGEVLTGGSTSVVSSSRVHVWRSPIRWICVQ